jgi:hypothetical protein
LAQKTAIVPGQKAVFQFEPVIWVGVVTELIQGQPISSAVISDINTKFNLTGIASADIVLTGGGAGPDGQPYDLAMDNVVMA